MLLTGISLASHVVDPFEGGQLVTVGQDLAHPEFIHIGIYYLLSQWLTLHYSWGGGREYWTCHHLISLLP